MANARAALAFWLMAAAPVAAEDAIVSRAAWVAAAQVNLRAGPSHEAKIIGYAERGDRLSVIGCTPGCEAPRAWAQLSPLGAVRLALLTFEAPAELPPLSGYLYAKVARGGAVVRAAPSESARRVARRDAGDVVALRGPPTEGWAQLVAGGFLPEAQLRMLTPSARRGVHDPEGPLAFVIAEVLPDEALGIAGAGGGEALEARSRDKRFVEVEGGRLPVGAVRIASARPRPAQVREGERWVHIDLNEQVLTAYEGDHWRFATLVSTGVDEWETPRGLSRVWLKVRHALMDRTTPPARYHVEEVPDAMYFRGDAALHGAAWHDKFGRRASHGCVNLSPDDARWLFDWAPPPLPEGWHALFVERAGLEGLWVQVEAAPRWTSAGEELSRR